ncbi:hypothetical protein OHJ21_05305 [Virgibacillus sp. LDC1]|nr:hypothetical protein [Virgibacillus sp. LDC1]
MRKASCIQAANLMSVFYIQTGPTEGYINRSMHRKKTLPRERLSYMEQMFVLWVI